MTAIEFTAPARPAIRIPLPTIDVEALKARVARLIGMPKVLPGDWYL